MQTWEALSGTVLIVVVLALLWQTRKGRQVSSARQVDLAPGERFRQLRMEQLEPVIDVMLVGTILWADLSQNVDHVIAGAIGLLPGIAFGAYRARLMYVRSYPELRGVVLRRSLNEYIAVAVLIVVKLLAEDHQLLPNTGWFSLLITGLLAFVVAESVGRSVVITRWYHRDTARAA